MKILNNYDDLILAMDHLAIQENNILFFLQVLKETNNIDFWLILPLEIAKTHDVRLVPVLIDLLQDSRTIGYRGNFLTALMEYDYLPYSRLLVDLACNGNWELRTKSAQMLLKIKDQLPTDIIQTLEVCAKNALDDSDEKCQFLCELMQIFDIEID